MQFDNLPSNPYLNIVFDIIRKGIISCVSKLNNSDNEDLKNQLLADTFNAIGTVSEKLWVGVGKENKSKGKQTREDIYFYLNDDKFTRIFYVEGKRLPKYNTQSNEEYVIGTNNSGNSSGGIERFKKGIHGDSNRIFDNGLIAYIENNSIEYWLKTVNNSISHNFNSNEILKEKEIFNNEYISLHQFDYEDKSVSFYLHHFWINLSNT
ncbi:MAG: hypothetical protein GQ564_15685 [Bacteroidales bacterium]|nr:hypothetical protein [Bacteroidales bacterium]